MKILGFKVEKNITPILASIALEVQNHTGNNHKFWRGESSRIALLEDALALQQAGLLSLLQEFVDSLTDHVNIALIERLPSLASLLSVQVSDPDLLEKSLTDYKVVMYRGCPIVKPKNSPEEPDSTGSRKPKGLVYRGVPVTS